MSNEKENKLNEMWLGNRDADEIRFAYIAKAMQTYLPSYLDGKATEEERQLVDKLRQWGWEAIRRFAYDVAHRMLKSYKPSAAKFYDVEIELYKTYCEHIADYNVNKGKPTTFFVRYFRGAIREFILFNYHNINSYDAQNYRKIKKAIEFYELQRIAYTPEMLSTKTGLSVKIINSTLKYIDQSHYANIDDTYKEAGTIDGPETAYLKKEMSNELIDIINNILTDIEKKVFYTCVNLEGAKKLPFDTVAESLNLSLKQVKTIYNSARIHIAENEEFIRYFGRKQSRVGKHTKKEENFIPIHDKVENNLKKQGEYLLKISIDK